MQVSNPVMANHVLSLVTGDSVLDFGSGAGLYGFLLRFAYQRTSANKPFSRIDAVDSSPQTVEGVKKMGIYDNVYQSTSLKLPFADNSYDTVICLECLEHLYFEDVPVLISELVRVCKKNLILSTPPESLVCNSKWCKEELARAEAMTFMDSATFFDKLGETHKSCISPTRFLENGFKSFLKSEENNIFVEVIADTHIYVLDKAKLRSNWIEPTVGVLKREFAVIEGKDYLDDYKSIIRDQLSLDDKIAKLKERK